MALRISTNLRNAILTEVCGGLEFGSFELYAGTVPSTADDPAGTTLASLSPSFGTPSNGQAVSGSTTGTAQATGTATYGRWGVGSGWVIQGTVGTAGSGADFIIDDTSIVSGEDVTLAASTLTYPE